MTLLLNPDYSFPESDREAIRNLALCQSVILTMLEGYAAAVAADDDDIADLWSIAKGLNQSVEVYCE